MSLLLTLERSPRPQQVRQMRLEDGEMVIGRGADADWRIDDPDMYVSRSHCTVAGRAGSFTVTDTSTGGLFVDEAPRPLGDGNSAALRDGMRLRLGDYVLRVEIRAEAQRAAGAGPARTADPFDTDGFFAATPEPEPRHERPPDLPDPFERPVRSAAAEPAPERRGPPGFDDPFTLDPAPSERNGERAPGGFDWDTASTPRESRARERPPPGAFSWDEPAPERRPEPEPARPAPEPPEAVRQPMPRGGAPDAALAAFLRGLGLDAADAPAGDELARMEALGREYRLMAQGLMHLLRMRAQEKGNARIAQTVVGTAENNPLKFMPTVEDALAVMLSPRGSGFADAEGAIAGAVRDLARHQVGSWRGIQAALRRMLDRFDPKVLEAELESLGLLEKLLAGGRRAKLWELYEKRFREIARSAETRFLGEVGADFRDAYESEEK
jgi:type VI secretion system protein ImpI